MLREWHLAAGYSEQGGWEGGEMLIMTFTVTFSRDFLKRVKTTETERCGQVRSLPLIKLWLCRATARGQFLFSLIKWWGGGQGHPHWGCRVDWWGQYLSFNSQPGVSSSEQSLSHKPSSLLFQPCTEKLKWLINMNKMTSNWNLL